MLKTGAEDEGRMTGDHSGVERVQERFQVKDRAGRFLHVQRRSSTVAFPSRSRACPAKPSQHSSKAERRRWSNSGPQRGRSTPCAKVRFETS